MDELLSWAACVAGARPSEEYRRLLQEAGFVDLRLEDASCALADMAEDVAASHSSWTWPPGLENSLTCR